MDDYAFNGKHSSMLAYTVFRDERSRLTRAKRFAALEHEEEDRPSRSEVSSTASDGKSTSFAQRRGDENNLGLETLIWLSATPRT